MLEYFLLFAAGLAGGFLAGLLGIGGGIIYITILPFIFRQYGLPEELQVQFVVANSIFGTFFAAFAGNLAQIKDNFFFWKEVFFVGLAATIFSIVTLHYVVHMPWYSKEVFSIIIIVLLVFILFKTIKNVRLTVFQETEPNKYKLFLTGITGGVVAALSGLGGGAVMVPLLNLGLKMDIKKAKSISLGVIFISAACMTIFNMLPSSQAIELIENHWSLGYIVFSVAIPLGLGVVIGSPYGVKIGNKMSSKQISFIFSAFILIVIINKLYGLIF